MNTFSTPSKCVIMIFLTMQFEISQSDYMPFYNYISYIGSVAERSKALVLGTSLFGGVGSNPTAATGFGAKTQH